jgi:hypothetical protein
MAEWGRLPTDSSSGRRQYTDYKEVEALKSRSEPPDKDFLCKSRLVTVQFAESGGRPMDAGISHARGRFRRPKFIVFAF